MRIALSLALAAVAGPALAQPGPAAPPGLRETAGCAAVFMTMGRVAADPRTTGEDPLVGALGAAFGRSWQVKGRSLYARAAEDARRRRLPPEAVFEAGVGYLTDAYADARAQAPGGQADFTTEAARLVERCVVAFPDVEPEY
jgi:hypothetical protein